LATQRSREKGADSEACISLRGVKGKDIDGEATLLCAKRERKDADKDDKASGEAGETGGNRGGAWLSGLSVVDRGGNTLSRLSAGKGFGGGGPMQSYAAGGLEQSHPAFTISIEGRGHVKKGGGIKPTISSGGLESWAFLGTT